VVSCFFFVFFWGGGGRLVVDAIVSLWRFWYGVGVEVSLYWIPLFELNFFARWITFLIPLLHPKPEPKLTLSSPGPNGNGTANASSPSAASPGGGIMSNGLPDPDTLLTPSGTPVDGVNGVLNGATVNGLNGTPIRKDSGEEGGPGGGRQQGDGGVVKANMGMILRKSVEYIRWVCFRLGLESIL